MKNTIQQKFLAATLACGLIGSATVETVYAAESTYPADMCVRLSGPLFKQTWGSIYNPSTTKDMRVSCPIISEVNYITEVMVRATDNNASNGKDIKCRIQVITRDPSNSAPNKYLTPYRSTVAFGAQVQEIRLFDHQFSPVQSIGSRDNAGKNIVCVIPRKSVTGPSLIHHYKVFFSN